MYPAQDMMADLDGEPFKAYCCRTCTDKWEPYTVRPEDVGRKTIEAFGRRRMTVTDFLGRILPGDVGKRVYMRGGVCQVENDEQRASRAQRESR